MLYDCNLSEPVTLKVLLSSRRTPRKTRKCSFALMRTKPRFWISVFYEHQPLHVTPEAQCKSVVICCGDKVDLCEFSAAGPGRIVKTEHKWSEPKWSSLNENIYFEKDRTLVGSQALDQVPCEWPQMQDGCKRVCMKHEVSSSVWLDLFVPHHHGRPCWFNC